MGMSTGGSDDLNAEINVTPMVDIMLVLLIIFMITAPMMQGGVEIDLPKVNAQKIEDPDANLTLSITRDSQLLLGATPVTWQTLEAKLQANARIKAEKALYIDADAALPYGVVVTAMAVAKGAGVEKVMMVTVPANGDLGLDKLDATARAAGPTPTPATPPPAGNGSATP